MRHRQVGGAAGCLPPAHPLAPGDEHNGKQRAQPDTRSRPEQSLFNRILNQEDATQRQRKAANPNHPARAEKLFQTARPLRPPARRGRRHRWWWRCRRRSGAARLLRHRVTRFGGWHIGLGNGGRLGLADLWLWPCRRGRRRGRARLARGKRPAFEPRFDLRQPRFDGFQPPSCPPAPAQANKQSDGSGHQQPKGQHYEAFVRPVRASIDAESIRRPRCGFPGERLNSPLSWLQHRAYCNPDQHRTVPRANARAWSQAAAQTKSPATWAGLCWLFRKRDGAVEKTRTSTGCPTATSTLRVYQFRHDRRKSGSM